MENQKSSATNSIIALVCGIVSIVLSFFAYVNFVSIALGIVAIVFSVKGKKTEDKKGMATAGLVCGIIGLALACTVGMCSTCAACALQKAADATNDYVNALNSIDWSSLN